MNKKQRVIQPPFPDVFNGYSICWGQGNNLVSPRLLASIPLFSIEKDPVRKVELEKLYWEEKDREYNSAKDVYLANVFIGTVWYGSFPEISARITKIVTQGEKHYVCFKASDEQLEYCKKTGYKPTSPSKYPLSAFLSAINNGSIKVKHTPIKQTNG